MASIEFTQASLHIVEATTPTTSDATKSEPMKPGLVVENNASTVFSDNLLSAVVHLKMGELGYNANLKAFATTNTLWGSLMDMVDTPSRHSA